MIDHITFGVSDFGRSTRFYDRALAPLGVRRLFDVPPEHSGGVSSTGYGDGRPWFWIAEQDATRGKLHVAIEAADRAAVDAFHREALAAGGADNGPPVRGLTIIATTTAPSFWIRTATISRRCATSRPQSRRAAPAYRAVRRASAGRPRRASSRPAGAAKRPDAGWAAPAG